MPTCSTAWAEFPPSGCRLVPTPGTATEQDVIAVHDRTNRLCELVDGVLVEKVMGFDESRFAVLLAAFLVAYLNRNDLGTIVGADGMMRLFPGLVRIPDVAFISWKRYPKKRRKRGEIPTVAPDLVVEVLSKGNTPREMAQARGVLSSRRASSLVRRSETTEGSRLHRSRSLDRPGGR